MGTNNLEQGGTEYEVSVWIAHDSYSSELANYDIGLLETNEKIKFGELVWPLSLPNENPICVPTLPVIVSGWGWNKVCNCCKI